MDTRINHAEFGITPFLQHVLDDLRQRMREAAAASRISPDDLDLGRRADRTRNEYVEFLHLANRRGTGPV